MNSSSEHCTLTPREASSRRISAVSMVLPSPTSSAMRKRRGEVGQDYLMGQQIDLCSGESCSRLHQRQRVRLIDQPCSPQALSRAGYQMTKYPFGPAYVFEDRSIWETLAKKKQELEQEIALGKREYARRFACNGLAFHAHFVSFGVDFDVGSGAIVQHVFFPNAAAVADRLHHFFQA